MRRVTRSPSIVLALVAALSMGAACEPAKPAAQDPLPAPPARNNESSAPAPPPVTEPGELAPGSLDAFGVIMPIGTEERFTGPSTKIFYVSAEMPRVMRYLKRRFDTEKAEGDIHPMAVMLKGVKIRDARGEQGELRFDLGVRDEGDRTQVTLWKHSERPAPPRNTAESLRAAGFDPQGRPLPSNNY